MGFDKNVVLIKCLRCQDFSNEVWNASWKLTKNGMCVKIDKKNLTCFKFFSFSGKIWNVFKGLWSEHCRNKIITNNKQMIKQFKVLSNKTQIDQPTEDK